MTQRYINITQQGKNDWWRYLLGFLMPLLSVLVVAVLGAIVFTIYNTTFLNVPSKELWNRLPTPMIASYVMTVMMGFTLGMHFVIERLHQRPFLSLISADATFYFQRLLQAMGLWLLLRCGTGLLSYSQNPQNWQFVLNFTAWLTMMPFIGIFCIIITSVILLYVLAYPFQAMSVIFQKPWLLTIVVSAILTTAHQFLPSSQLISNPVEAIVTRLLTLICFVIWFRIILKDNRFELLLGIGSAEIFYSTAIAKVIESPANSFFDAFPAIWQVQPTPNLFERNLGLYIAFQGLFLLRLAIFYYVFLGRRDRATPTNSA